MDLPVYYINLDRSSERRDYMKTALTDQELWEQSHRIVAVDAKTDELRDAFSRDLWSHCWSLDNTVIACFESHRKAWARFLEGSADAALVLEDDVVFSPQFRPSLVELHRNARNFDVIKLDGNPFRMRMGPAKSHGQLALREILATTFSTAGYLVSRAGAKRLLEETERYNVAVDIFAFTPRRGWRQYVCDPSICVQGVLLDADKSPSLPQDVLKSIRHQAPSWRGPTPQEPGWWTLKNRAQYWFTRKLPDVLWRRRHIARIGGSIERLPLQDDFAGFRW